MSDSVDMRAAGNFLMIASHVLLLLPIWWCIEVQVWLALDQFIGVLVFSTYYHLCKANVLCFGIEGVTDVLDPSVAAAKMDYYNAYSLFVVSIYVIFSTAPSMKWYTLGRYKSLNPRLPKWYYHREFAFTYGLVNMNRLLVLVVVLFMDVQNYYTGALVIVFGTTLFLFIKFTFVDMNYRKYFTRYRLSRLAGALLLLLVSMYFFVVDDRLMYAWAHSMWHIAVFLGEYLILLAATSDPLEQNNESFIRAMYKMTQAWRNVAVDTEESQDGVKTLTKSKVV